MNVHVKDTHVENPKEAFGKLKPCIHLIPMFVILGVAKVMALGAKKYGQKNWRVQPINASTYYSAMCRHMVQWFELGEDIDEESQQHHLEHVIACAMIVLDGLRHGKLNDDRAFCEALHRNTEG